MRFKDISSIFLRFGAESNIGTSMRAGWPLVWDSSFQKTQVELHFWRTRAGVEVDFILYGSNTFYAIEVKNGKAITPHDLSGLKEFQKDYPEATLILIYRGKEKIKRDGILCLPAEEFFLQMNLLSTNPLRK